MKLTTKLRLLILIMINLNFGCKKYPDNPEFKGYLKSATSLIVGNQYKVNSFWVDGIDSTANFRQYSYYDAIVHFKKGKGGRLDNRVELLSNPNHPLDSNHRYYNYDGAVWKVQFKQIFMTDGFVSNIAKMGLVMRGGGDVKYDILRIYGNDFWIEVKYNNKIYTIKFIKNT